MAIFSTRSGRALGIIRLRGDLDIFHGEEIARRLRLLESLRFSILDLRGAAMIDATFLGQLASLRRKNVERAGSIVLIVDNPALHRVLALVRFNDLFPIVRTEAEAYDALENLPLEGHSVSGVPAPT